MRNQEHEFDHREHKGWRVHLNLRDSMGIMILRRLYRAKLRKGLGLPDDTFDILNRLRKDQASSAAKKKKKRSVVEEPDKETK